MVSGQAHCALNWDLNLWLVNTSYSPVLVPKACIYWIVMDHLIVKHCPCIRITYKRNIVAEDAARRVHFLKPAVAIASLANQSCKACSGWVFAAVEKVFQWNYPAWSDAISADSDGCGAIEQPLEMIKSIGRSPTQTHWRLFVFQNNIGHALVAMD